MKRWTTLAETITPDGARLCLQRRDDEFVLRTAGHVLMSSRSHGSEEAMAKAALVGVTASTGRILIGGLGMGFTLRAALDLLGGRGQVVVAEVSGAVLDWNRGPLAHLAHAPLSDARVRVHEGDIVELLRGTSTVFDVILLDVDNGPAALSRPTNAWLYTPEGLLASRRALRAGGRLAVWSASPDVKFEGRLRKAGFEVEVRRVATRDEGSRARHVLFLATSP